VRFRHPIHRLKVLHIEGGGLANTGQDRLLRACGAMHVKTNFHHSRQHTLDLFFGGVFLHSYNHFRSRFV
jgi:hypothetical protein